MTTNFTLRVSSTGEAPSVVVNEGGTVDLEPINQHLTSLDNDVSSLVTNNLQNEESINMLNSSVTGLSNLVNSIDYKINTNNITANIFTGGLCVIPFSINNGNTYDYNLMICRVGLMKHLIIRSFTIPANATNNYITLPITIGWGSQSPQQIEEIVGSDRTLEMICPCYWKEPNSINPTIIRVGKFTFKLGDSDICQIQFDSSFDYSTVNTFSPIFLSWI